MFLPNWIVQYRWWVLYDSTGHTNTLWHPLKGYYRDTTILFHVSVSLEIGKSLFLLLTKFVSIDFYWSINHNLYDFQMKISNGNRLSFSYVCWVNKLYCCYNVFPIWILGWRGSFDISCHLKSIYCRLNQTTN